MKRLVRLYVIPLVCCLLLGSSGCGKSNIFSWAHSSGSDSSSVALSSDANTALQNKDYNKALEYYQKMLESDPANSEAIYGAAAAELANAGLDIGSLVANLVQQQQAPAAHNLAPSIAVAARTIPSSNNDPILPGTIIARLQTLRPAVNSVLSDARLLRIIQGRADGKIAPDNPDVNLNIAFCLIVRAAIKVYDVSPNIHINSDYTVTGLEDLDVPTKQNIGKDVVGAFYRLKTVMNKLNLGDSSAVADINGDVQKLLTNLGFSPDFANTDYYLLGLTQGSNQ